MLDFLAPTAGALRERTKFELCVKCDRWIWANQGVGPAPVEVTTKGRGRQLAPAQASRLRVETVETSGNEGSRAQKPRGLSSLGRDRW